jgi:hypothetical protein
MQEATVEAFDALGNPLQIGDRIVYAAAVSSSARLEFGTVAAITGRKDYYDEGVVLPTVKVKKDEGKRYSWSRDHVTLTKMTNILVVEPVSEED